MKSGLLLLIAVALVSEKRPRVGSQEQSKAEANKNKAGWMEQEALANKTSKDPKKTQKKRIEQPQRRLKRHSHPKGIRTKATQ